MKSIELFYAGFVASFLVMWIVCRANSATFLQIRHSYEYPTGGNCTGELISDRWSFEASREALMSLHLIIPFSICFMMWSREKVAWGLHIVLTIVMFCWSVITLGFDLSDMGSANVDPSDVNFRPENLARDRRWCLYYGGQPNTQTLCANQAPCSGDPVDPGTFGINGPFLWRFIFNIIICAMLLVNIFTVWSWRTMIHSGAKRPTRYKTLKK